MDYLQLACALLFILSLTIQQITGVPQSVSACISQPQNEVKFSCGYGSMLRITKTFYGYTDSNLCEYQPGDCIEEERKAYPCTGKDWCSINLPSGGVGREIECNKSKKRSNYFQVNYECIPVAESKDICNFTSGELKAQKGYIMTPGYPNNYRSNTQCKVSIKVEDYQTIKLYTLDMDLEKDEATHTCKDYILAKDSTGSTTVCGRRWNEASEIKWKDLQIEFKSDAVNNNKGFWLYYEAIPHPTTTTKKPTTPTTTVRKITQQSTSRPVDKVDTGGNVIPVTKTVNNINIDKKEKVPFAAIVGGVIGTLSLILIILLVLLIVKWVREKSRRRDKNLFIEVQNPGYRNSNEFQQNRPHLPRQDLCYNYMDV